MKNIFLLYITVLFSGIVYSQQDPHFTQYFDNNLFLNPAYAGSTKMLSMSSIHREQWLGFEGRPSSTTFSIHSPLPYESIGIGLTAVRDVIGPIKQNMVAIDFSYTLKLTEKQKLSFGLKGGMNVINSETNTLSTVTPNDPKFNQNLLNEMNPNFGFGIYYHSPSFFLGVSTPRIIEQSIGTSSYVEKRHYYAFIGGVMKLSSNWKLRPTAQIKSAVGAPISVDISLTGIYNNKIYLGGMYRYEAAYGVFCQYQISDQFRLGLASDFASSELRNYNTGTFELMLSYDFNFNKGGIRSPRYF